jgi:DNA-binding transcriptional regulator YdaS (Cro superfamily)
MSNMTLIEYFSTEPRGAKSEMAAHLRISATWLSLIMWGERKASPALCVRIQDATGGLVTTKELRPDIFR